MLKFLLSLFLASNLQAQASIIEPITPPVSRSWNPLEVITVASPPPELDTTKKPEIKAKSALIIDVNSGHVLYEKNSYEKRAVASLTKLMTAVIVAENHDSKEIVTIEKQSPKAESVKMWLSEGEKITVKNLLKGLLIPSANDAALALAIYHSGDVSSFVDQMNKKAQLLGLKNTHFSNPAGFDSEKNYSTVQDLAILARYALKNQLIKEIVATKTEEVTSLNGKIVHQLESSNKLLWTESGLIITGLKTGHTPSAGYCLIATAQNKNNEQIMTIVLDSPARFTESEQMLKWALGE